MTSSLMILADAMASKGLSNLQGMISQGDVELSIISKNFFFVFFNFFVIFTILGTASGYDYVTIILSWHHAHFCRFIDLWNRVGDRLRDATSITNALASSLQKLINFYTNFIILQGLGLFPFRLMEFGSVAYYPINLIGAKTPRGKVHDNSLNNASLKSSKIMQSWCSRLSSATDSTYPRLS
jgi:calcium permeable stress-gated cation channel